MSPAPTTPFGSQLRHWRRLRRLSQLDLAAEAEVSARHVCFLETGRSRPSQEMVLRLAEALDLTLREANSLLTAAGFGEKFPARRLSDAQMAPFRDIVDQMLEHHQPYPGFVIDRCWNIVRANATARMMVPALATGEVVNGIDLFYGDGPMRTMVENFEEVAHSARMRLRREVLHSGGDPELTRLLERLEAHLDGLHLPDDGAALDTPVLCSRLRVGGQVISTVSTIVQFSTARDVNLDELRIELLFPSDEASATFFASLGDGIRS